MAPVTDEQVELVRSLVAAIPLGRVSTYGDIAARRAFQSAYCRLDYADRFLGSALAPGDQSLRAPSTAPGHPAVGVVARRGRSQC